MGLALLKAEHPVHVEAGVHAGQHGDMLTRRHGEAALGEGGHVLRVVAEKLVGHAHAEDPLGGGVTGWSSYLSPRGPSRRAPLLEVRCRRLQTLCPVAGPRAPWDTGVTSPGRGSSPSSEAQAPFAQATQIPGTATFWETWGVATARSGWRAARFWNSGEGKATPSVGGSPKALRRARASLVAGSPPLGLSDAIRRSRARRPQVRGGEFRCHR